MSGNIEQVVLCVATECRPLYTDLLGGMFVGEGMLLVYYHSKMHPAFGSAMSHFYVPALYERIVSALL